jgi:ribosomal protein S18 acetylase RimI-like enzyme
VEARLRPAALEDAEAVARLHVQIWRKTYGQIAPADVVAPLSALDVRIERWRGMLAGRQSCTLVAELDGRIVGFGRCGAPSDPIFGARGEVKHLFVDNAHARRGVGRALLGGLARELKRQGFSGIGLGVVKENEPAIAFYRALGGEPAGQYRDAGPLWRSDNLLIVWEDASALTGL